MPVFRAGSGQAPPWCEMRQFDIVRLPAGAARYDFGRAGPREKLIVGEGACTVGRGRPRAGRRQGSQHRPAGRGRGGRLQHPRGRRGHHPDPHGRPLGRRGRRLRAVLGGGGGRRRARRPGRSPSPTRSGPASTATSTTATSTGSSSPAAASPSRRGRATRSPQATAWPPAWATTTTSRSCTNRCGRLLRDHHGGGEAARAICGTIRTGRRSRRGSGCEGEL